MISVIQLTNKIKNRWPFLSLSWSDVKQTCVKCLLKTAIKYLTLYVMFVLITVVLSHFNVPGKQMRSIRSWQTHGATHLLSQTSCFSPSWTMMKERMFFNRLLLNISLLFGCHTFYNCFILLQICTLHSYWTISAKSRDVILRPPDQTPPSIALNFVHKCADQNLWQSAALGGVQHSLEINQKYCQQCGSRKGPKGFHVGVRFPIFGEHIHRTLRNMNAFSKSSNACLFVFCFFK